MKMTKKSIGKLLKNNPAVDADALRKSIELVEYIRKVGAKNPGTVTPPFEPSLEVKPITRKIG